MTSFFLGGSFSYNKIPTESVKPLIQWSNTDFVLNACIYCMNNGDYHGSTVTTPEEYERHIVSKHKGKPAYPGPADIKPWPTLNDKCKSKVAENGRG